MTVRELLQSDAERATAALAAAFLDDPVTAWVTPDREARTDGLPVFFGAMVEAFTRHGTSTVTDDAAGVALWSPPGVALMTPEQEQAFGERVMTSGDPDRLLAVLGAMEAVHPAAPHHYLGFMGVVPSRQGQGLGAALLAPVLSRCDAEGAPAYLEASTRDSARLYARHGFVETGEIVVPGGGPSLWAMWREPSGR